MESSPAGQGVPYRAVKAVKRSAGKASGLIQSLWKAVKSIIPRRHADRAERFTTPHPDDPEPVRLSGEDREDQCRIYQTPDADPENPSHPADPELVRLPGEDREDQCRIYQTPDADPENPSHPADPELVRLPGEDREDQSSIYQTPDDPELPPVPDSFSFDLFDTTAKKGRKRKAVCAFSRRFCKALMDFFLCHDTAQHLSSQPYLDKSEPMPVQVSFEIKSVAEPESGQIWEDLQTTAVQNRTRKSHVFHVGKLIASGAFGKVYEGTHVSDDKIKIAIKHINRCPHDRYLDVPGSSTPVLAEAALMLRLGQTPSCPNIIQLYHWLERERGFCLIMEKPHPSQSLFEYIQDSDDINEVKAFRMIGELVRAVKHCVERGVYHGDIHSRNILVTTDDSLKLKLIDFGCARLITSEGFNSREYRGARLCTPPEVIRDTIFHAEPAYVWAVGVVLFEILHRRLPFKDFQGIPNDSVQMKPTLSPMGCDLLYECLARNPAKRLKLQQLEEHLWFKSLKAFISQEQESTFLVRSSSSSSL